MRRRLAPVLATIAVCACGASPAAPVPIELFRLSSGPHTLTIQIAPTITTNPLGFTSSIMVCVGSGNGSVSIPVDVMREGDIWIARPAAGSLRLHLRETGSGVEGSLEGSASQAGTTVVVNNGVQPAVLPATTYGGAAVGGPVEGGIRFVTAQTEQSCSSNAWSIGPRR